MQQISLFDQAETTSAQFAKPVKKSHTQTRVKAASAIAKATVKTKPKQKPKPQNKPSSPYSPYGVCHRCARAIAIPGLDTSYCQACGWVSRPKNLWVGGES